MIEEDQLEQDLMFLKSSVERVNRIVKSVEESPLVRLLFCRAQMDKQKSEIMPLSAVQKKAIIEALIACDGNVMEASKLLRIGKATLYRRIKEYKVTIELLAEDKNGKDHRIPVLDQIRAWPKANH